MRVPPREADLRTATREAAKCCSGPATVPPQHSKSSQRPVTLQWPSASTENSCVSAPPRMRQVRSCPLHVFGRTSVSGGLKSSQSKAGNFCLGAPRPAKRPLAATRVQHANCNFAPARGCKFWCPGRKRCQLGLTFALASRFAPCTAPAASFCNAFRNAPSWGKNRCRSTSAICKRIYVA